MAHLLPRLKPFTFGADARIPEAPPESFEGALLGAPDYPDLELGEVEAPPARRRYETLPRIEFPRAPEYEEMPETAPRGVKDALKRALLGMIPGYREGFEGEIERRRQDIGSRNKYRYDIFRELMDQASAEARLRETAAQHGIANELAAGRLDVSRGSLDLRAKQLEISDRKAGAYMEHLKQLQALGWDRAALGWDRLEQEIASDSELMDHRRNQLAELVRHQKTAEAQRATEEAGRQERAAYVQDQINQRQARLLEKGYTPAQIEAATARAFETARSNPKYDSMTPEQQLEMVNVIIDAAFGGKVPVFSTKPAGGLRGAFGGVVPSVQTTKPLSKPSVPPIIGAPTPGTNRVPPPAQPAAAPATTPQKVVTMERVKAYAGRYGVSVEQAIQKAIEDGFTIAGK